MDPSLARRNSASSASPYLTEIYCDAGEEGKPTGNLTVGECLRLAKAMTDHTQLPASCKDYIDKHLAVQKAYEGAGGNMAAKAIIAKQGTGKGITQAQLQRRWTSRRDPLEKKK